MTHDQQAEEKQAVEADHSQLVLSGSKDIRVAGELQMQLIDLLSVSGATTLRCDELDSLDTSTIQLFLAAKREAGNSLQFEASATSACADWLRQAGVAGYLLNDTSALS